jgi:hypothetical protein
MLSLLLIVEFDMIFCAIGLSLHIPGAMIFPTFTVPMKIMKSTIHMNPIFANFLAGEILFSNAKMDEIAKSPTIGTAADTKIDRFGNSNGEKDDIVKSIRIPEMTVASTMIISLELRFMDGPEDAGEEEDDGVEDVDGDDIFVEDFLLFYILLINYALRFRCSSIGLI